MGCKIWFDESSCVLQERTQGLMIGMGRQVVNLYFLDIETVSVQAISVYSVVANVSSPDLWHKRLGHPYMSKIQPMYAVLSFPKFKSDIAHHCRVCHLAKQRHIPFVSDNNKSTIPFELIHIDTWGPFSVSTHDGYKYFLTIVDDCSRATCRVYLLKQKCDVLEVFPTFINMVETQFETKVRVLGLTMLWN